MNDLTEILETVAIMAVPVVLAVVLHEVAHGYVAYLRGDTTAKDMGRLSLNPIRHIDWFGTVALPALFYATTGYLFAYAKPVPVNIFNLRDPKRDMIAVAAAGPVTNVLLAAISAALFKTILWYSPDTAKAFYMIQRGLPTESGDALLVPLLMMCYFSVFLNVVLATINLIPIPPADGGRIVSGLLPDEQAIRYSRLEPYGLVLLVFLLFVNPFGIINYTVEPVIMGIIRFLL